MSKDNSRLWLGFAAGMAAGVFIAMKSSNRRRMPNAKEWQQILSIEHGQIEAAALIARVQQRYDELVIQSGVFQSKALQGHLLEIILPMLATYQIWRDDGFDQESALAKVDALYETQYKTSKKGLPLLERALRVLPGGFGTFKQLVRWVVSKGFPPPGFELAFVQDDDRYFSLEFRRCFYKDIVTFYGAPELTASFCKVDNFTMEALPEQIQWTRSGTLGMGASCCDFRWEYVALDQVE